MRYRGILSESCVMRTWTHVIYINLQPNFVVIIIIIIYYNNNNIIIIIIIIINPLSASD